MKRAIPLASLLGTVEQVINQPHEPIDEPVGNRRGGIGEQSDGPIRMGDFEDDAVSLVGSLLDDTRFREPVGVPFEGAAGDIERVRDLGWPGGVRFEEIQEDLAGGLPACERERSTLPGVVARRVVVGAPVEPVAGYLLVADEPPDVILDLSGCERRFAHERVEVDAGVGVNVLAYALSGVVRRGHSLRSDGLCRHDKGGAIVTRRPSGRAIHAATTTGLSGADEPGIGRMNYMGSIGLVLQWTQWPAPEYTPVLLAVIALATLGTVGLFLIGLVAYSRRRTPRYLLVTLALGALVVRTVVGLGTVLGIVPMTAHHLVGHGLDFLIAVLILAAAYLTGTDVPVTPLSDAD